MQTPQDELIYEDFGLALTVSRKLLSPAVYRPARESFRGLSTAGGSVEVTGEQNVDEFLALESRGFGTRLGSMLAGTLRPYISRQDQTRRARTRGASRGKAGVRMFRIAWRTLQLAVLFGGKPEC